MTTHRIVLSMVMMVALVFPQSVAAFEVAGWIPWWQDTMGTESARDHIYDLDIIYPFAFEVTADGELVDKANLDESKWQNLMQKARQRHVRVIPTILWNDGAAIDEVLSDEDKRSDHIKAIIDMVDEGDYDGVNIDYESKLAKTKDDYSTFLKELADELGSKKLTCTIEARTPTDSLYREPPKKREYANDYEAMTKYCDWVEIMAYDQQRADLKLNDARKGKPYVPVADTEWVEKVLKLALKDIPADKIMLGVPTYGRQWNLTVAPAWFKEYKGVSSINVPDARELAEEYDVTIDRNEAGEASYTYFPEDSPFHILDVLPVPAGTLPGLKAAAQALLFATWTDMEVPVRVVWFSDAHAVAEKVDLAKKYDLRGVALFKIDGEEDPNIWKLF